MRLLATIICTALLVGGCASTSDSGGSGETISSLEGKQIDIRIDRSATMPKKKVIEGYREFLKAQPDYPLRAEAMRRLADLEMETREEQNVSKSERTTREAETVRRMEEGTASPKNYRDAIKLYSGLLKAYPHYPGNDRVMYQLAKAYEQAGQQRKALSLLTKMVKKFPNSEFFDEAQFRRGELYFVFSEYAKAEEAYNAVVQFGARSVFYERSVFMNGWSQFKQSKYRQAIRTFTRILDRRLVASSFDQVDSVVKSMGRAEKEMLDESIRVLTLSFSYLSGAKSMEQHYESVGHRTYEYLIYQKMAELFIKQERIKDAAGVYAGFIKRYPMHKLAPDFHSEMIATYQRGRFGSLVLQSKASFVDQFGVDSRYWDRADSDLRESLKKSLKKHLNDLASYYHSNAQKRKNRDYYAQAAKWYRIKIKSFPGDPDTANTNFLLAESLYESQQYMEAAREYSKTAYDYPNHGKSTAAGYSVILSYNSYIAGLKDEKEKTKARRDLVDSSIKFADRFPQDKRVAGVLTKAAEDLFALHSPDRAAELAERVVALKPLPSRKNRKVAWTVIAHVNFERGGFKRAEQGYRQVLVLTTKQDKNRRDLYERLASSIYKQGEQERSSGNHQQAVEHFLRVGKVVPSSAVRANAEFDAAASLIKLKSWKRASGVLADFQKRYPGHKLQGQVIEKLATIYTETGESAKAARQFELLARTSPNPDVRREAQLQAASLYKKAGYVDRASSALQAYIKAYPRPLEPAIEARQELVEVYKKKRDARQYAYWLREVIQADYNGGKDRTDRTRFLAANATLTLSEPYYREFTKIKLTRPLKKSLAMKKQRMEEAIRAYTRAADYGVADVTTAATYKIGAIYYQLSQDLLKSERPKGLSPEETEQYNILLEEQAFPFEEKSIGIHENNVKRASTGIYDDWVKLSYATLGKIRPIRYGKKEKAEGAINVLH